VKKQNTEEIQKRKTTGWRKVKKRHMEILAFNKMMDK